MGIWQPISSEELSDLLESELQDCSVEQREFFAGIRVPCRHVQIHRLGNIEEVFVVAEYQAGVIYYEDIEEGFEFSHLGADGAIPGQGCNQYELSHVLAQLGF